MMATTAVLGLSAGKRLLSCSFYSSDLSDRLMSVHDLGVSQFQAASTKNIIFAKKSENFGARFPSDQHTQSIKAVREHVDTSFLPSTARTCCQRTDILEKDENNVEASLEVLILLQKSMLEKQWNLSFDVVTSDALEVVDKKVKVTRSGISARRRRTNAKRTPVNQAASCVLQNKRKHHGFIISPEMLQGRLSGYVNGVTSKELLSHAEVKQLSKKIQVGIFLEEHNAILKKKLGHEPSDEQLASSLRISRAELLSKKIECSFARDKLAMSNIRLVMAIAQKFDNMGAEMGDLVQGVSKALVENSKTLRLPSHLHERLSLIRNAKIKLEERGIAPSIEKIAETLNMSQKKVRNATEAVSKVLSLDRDAFPALNGLPGETLHSYIADNKLENNPWHGFDERSLKDEVNKLINTTLREREREIICLYFGLDKEPHTWEDIGRQFGLSRERIRQVGLVALEKLKHAARRKKLEAILLLLPWELKGRKENFVK
ncbi:hypothetical protein ACLOJK_034125 [Asimina triloba]